MSAGAAKANLMDAYKKLRLAWERASSSWSDDMSQKIGKEVMEPSEARVTAAIKGIEHAQELMAKVWRECSDDASEML